MLGRRALTEKEVAERLAARGFDQTEVGGALGRLRALGYCDDTAFARRRAGEMVEARGMSAIRVTAYLVGRGVPREVARSAAVEAVSVVGEERMIQISAERWLRGRAFTGTPAEVSGLTGFLGRQGFGTGAIRRLLQRRGLAPTAPRLSPGMCRRGRRRAGVAPVNREGSSS
jgi:regulatory protein